MSINIRDEINSQMKDLSSRLNVPLPGAPAAASVAAQYLSRAKSTDISYDAQAQDLFFRFLDMDAKNLNNNSGYEMWILDAKTAKIVAKYGFAMNPQNIQINVPTATMLEATMKGIYESHNGAPFRQITVTGTTGTNPIQSSPPSSGSSDLQRSVEYAFKNTIQAFNSTVNQAQRTINAFSSGSQKFEGPLNYKVTELQGNLSGYQSIHDLARFLDYYLAAKKLSKNKSWRLYFIMHKDQMHYACSLNNYSIVKASGTTEYQYTINMTAYRREASTNPAAIARGFKSAANAASSANTLSSILNGIRQARTTIAYAHRVLAGIRSDINESFIAPVGEIYLLGKELVGLGQSMYDFAFSGETLKAMEESFKQYFTDNKETKQSIAAAVGTLGLVGAISAAGKPESAMVTSAQDKLASGKAENFQDSQDSADPIKVLFENPADHPNIFEEFPLDDMNLPIEVSDQLDLTRQSVLTFGAEDVILRRNKIIDFSRSISEALGGGSNSYNAVKGLNAVKKTFKKLSVDDIVLLSQLNDICIQTDRLIALLDQSASNDRDDYYKFYADYAVAQGLKFNSQNLSRFFIPFPLGASLEQLAAQYLGTPDRWIEIAAINALKAPYVDEDGYEILVTASAGGDTLTVGVAEMLYVGQVVEVLSDVERVTPRKIRSIDVVNSIETIITFEHVDGKPLTIYRPSQRARIRANMPNTVNSNMLIAIPSDAPPKFDTTFKTSPEVNELNGLARIAKIDFLLDANGDLIFTGGGDIRLAYGMTNLIQAALLKLKTSTGQILNLPNYGNPAEVGANTAEVDAEEILRAINTSFDSDPRFSGILAGEVQKNGGTLSVSILVGVQNTQVTLPIMAAIPR
jgi:hypothetical protein